MHQTDVVDWNARFSATQQTLHVPFSMLIGMRNNNNNNNSDGDNMNDSGGGNHDSNHGGNSGDH
jgi:hypothetical protein